MVLVPEAALPQALVPQAPSGEQPTWRGRAPG